MLQHKQTNWEHAHMDNRPIFADTGASRDIHRVSQRRDPSRGRLPDSAKYLKLIVKAKVALTVESMTLPKQKILRPRAIRGFDNGQLPADLLVECGLGKGLLLVESAARAFKALVQFYGTHEDGIEISATGCYRSYNDQVTLFQQRFSETRIPGQLVKSFNGKKYWLNNGVAQAATPGKSNHGYGLALDICLLKNNKKISLTPQAIKLLTANAHQFGFCWELDSEPWHIVYFAGDSVPAYVEKVENDEQRFLTFRELKDLNAARSKKTQEQKKFAHGYKIPLEDWEIVCEIADANGVDPLILVAIGFAETAWFTKGDGLKGNGLGCGSYDSGSTYKYAGVRKQCEFACRNFKKNKVKTIDDIRGGKLYSTGKWVDGKYVGPGGSIKWASADTQDRGYPWTKNVVSIWEKLNGATA